MFEKIYFVTSDCFWLCWCVSGCGNTVHCCTTAIFVSLGALARCFLSLYHAVQCKNNVRHQYKGTQAPMFKSGKQICCTTTNAPHTHTYARTFNGLFCYCLCVCMLRFLRSLCSLSYAVVIFNNFRFQNEGRRTHTTILTLIRYVSAAHKQWASIR